MNAKVGQCESLEELIRDPVFTARLTGFAGGENRVNFLKSDKGRLFKARDAGEKDIYGRDQGRGSQVCI